MQIRLKSFSITEQDRRAIRFSQDRRKTQCSREEAKAFFEEAIQRALRDVRYRWDGPQTDEAVANGADPEGIASRDVA